MRVQLSCSIAALVLGSTVCLFTGCSDPEGNEVGTLPRSAGLESADGGASAHDDGEGADSPPIANADDAGSSTPANDAGSDGGAVHDAGAGDAGSSADASENDGGVSCNALVRPANDAPYYVRYIERWPSFTTAYSGGAIRDGMYVLTEDRSYPAYPRTPEGGDWTGTSWTTLSVTGNGLSAVVTDHDGGEERFNATIGLEGSRIYLTPLCGLDYQQTKSEWRELAYPFIKSGYTATDDTLTIGWMIGNHAAVVKVFQRVQDSQTTSP